MLTRVWEHGGDLLHRIDAQLGVDGAAADHPVWERLRQVGALPGDVVEHFRWMDPAALLRAQDQMIDQAEAARVALAGISATSWRGAGAAAFVNRWRHFAEFADGADERMADTAHFLAEAAQWIQRSRDELAVEMAACLGSREAVAIKVELNNRGAAADLAERILAAAASCLADGWRLRERWAQRLAEVPWREPSVGGPVVVDHLEVR
jgi:hypothetical protein